MTIDKATAGSPGLISRVKAAARKVPWILATWRAVKPPFQTHAETSVTNVAEIRDLQKILDLKLPPNAAFLSARASAHSIVGMFSDFSMAAIDSLLSHQDEENVNGSLLEFGVLQGRSAALVGRHLRGGERLVLVDIHDRLNPAAIAPFQSSVNFVLCATEDFEKKQPQYCKPQAYRFIHIDASHGYRATFTELAMADKFLAPKGIIVMDDFTNLNYSQNIAAIFKYLYTASTDLVFFLVTDEKGYLCRKSDFDFYGAFVLDRLIPEMASRDIGHCVLARTDTDPEYRAFYANAMPSPGEDGQFYGLNIYSNYYRTP